MEGNESGGFGFWEHPVEMAEESPYPVTSKEKLNSVSFVAPSTCLLTPFFYHKSQRGVTLTKKMSSAGIVLLDCGCQQYDWGKVATDSLVASLTSASPDAKMRKPSDKFAELWMGTHPSMPSRLRGAPNKTLKSFLLDDPEVKKRFFSKAHLASKHNGDIPFLLKILSIGKALSIQSHPNKELAEKLHKKDPKNYKDPNHKPELIVALTPFEGLCCFRKLADIQKFARFIPSLWELIGPSLESKKGEKDILKSIMTAVYHAPKAVIEKGLKAHAAYLKGHPNEVASIDEHRVFLRLMDEFPNDVGCWMIYILNYVKLAPGEGLYLRDSEPHAYLSGEGVEIMATSDNVVRAGLTPKFVDTEVLLGMLTYNTEGLDEAFRAFDAKAAVQKYAPPPHVEDFSLYRVSLAKQSVSSAKLALPTCGLGICVDGSGVVNGVAVKRGDIFAVVPEVSIATSADNFSVFVASTNDFTQRKSSL